MRLSHWNIADTATGWLLEMRDLRRNGVAEESFFGGTSSQFIANWDFCDTRRTRVVGNAYSSL